MSYQGVLDFLYSGAVILWIAWMWSCLVVSFAVMLWVLQRPWPARVKAALFAVHAWPAYMILLG
jgi:hypothetical protein